MPCLVITGASSGIGLATARAFIESGYEVINLSRSACNVDGVTNIACDLADPNFLPDIEATLHAGIAGAETLCLVHNAARLAHDCAAEVSPEELRSVYEINLIAPAVLNRMLLPSMSPGSSILYVGSTLGEKCGAGQFQLCHIKARQHRHDARHLPRPGGQRCAYRLHQSGLYRHGDAA